MKKSMIRTAHKTLLVLSTLLLGVHIGAQTLDVGDGKEVTLSSSETYSMITVNGRLKIDSGAVITADEVRIGYNGGIGFVELSAGARLVTPVVDLGSCAADAGNPDPGYGMLSLAGGAVAEGTVYVSRNCAANAGTAPTNEILLGEDSVLKGCVVKSCDPKLRIAFAGGLLRGVTGYHMLSVDGAGDVCVDSVDGQPIHVDCGGQHSTFPSFASTCTGKVHFRGTGDFFREGAPIVVDQPLHMVGLREIPLDDWSEFTGRIVAKDGGIRWFDSKQANQACGWAAMDGGFICVAPGRQAISSFTSENGGYITTKEASSTLVANVADNQSWDIRSPNVNIRKLKDGALTLVGKTPNLIEVGDGSVRLSAASTTAWKFYRFKVDKVLVAYDSVLQVSELKLYNGAEDVTKMRTGLTSGDTKGLSGWEDYSWLVDGDVNTKWCAENSSTDNYWVTLEFSGGQPVTRYEWYTAGDAAYVDEQGVRRSWREPMDWRFQGSLDGMTWYDLDSQKDFVATAERKALAYTGTCADVSPTVAAIDTVSAIVSAGAALCLDNGHNICPKGLYNYGSIVFGADAMLSCGADGADSEGVNLMFGGTGGIVKTGTGTTTLLGVNPTAGKVSVEQGVLRLGGAGTTAKYWRFTVKNVVTGLDRLFQLDELELLALDGTRVNVGITEVANVDGTNGVMLEPGTGAFIYGHGFTVNASESLNMLFDGNLNTKCCVVKLSPSSGNANPDRNNPDSWVQFVFRIRDDAKPAVWYQLISGTDAAGLRNPNDWKIESSFDGVNWTTHDDRKQEVVPMANSTVFNDGIAYALKNCQGSGCEPVPNASEITVAPGAELALAQGSAIGTLTIDFATGGAGTLRGFSAAANGELRLVNAPSEADLMEMESLPISLVDPGNTRNLRTWRVLVNGVAASGVRPKVDGNGCLVLRSVGMMMLVR